MLLAHNFSHESVLVGRSESFPGDGHQPIPETFQWIVPTGFASLWIEAEKLSTSGRVKVVAIEGYIYETRADQ